MSQGSLCWPPEKVSKRRITDYGAVAEVLSLKPGFPPNSSEMKFLTFLRPSLTNLEIFPLHLGRDKHFR